MRLAAILLTGLGLGATATAVPSTGAAAMGPSSLAPLTSTPAIMKVGYFCSPGFEVSGSRCVATASRDEVDLYLNETFGDAAPRRRHRHRRHGLRERY